MPTPQQTTAMSEKLANNLREFFFEPHNAETWDKITQSFYDLLNADVDIQDFAVKCDDTNNTQERVLAGELFCDVAVKHNGDENFTYYPLRIESTPVLPKEDTDVADSN